MQSELVTLVPPGTGGVRDYAEIMARHIPARVLAITPQTPLSDYGQGDIVLNFSGYGYHPRGVPAWLVERLREAKARNRKVGVFFHETFASGPPWRSAFWLGPTQRRIAADLARLSSFWLTNSEVTARWLGAHARDVPSRVLPVYSNVGEPGQAAGATRSNKIVVFGSAATRLAVYRTLEPAFWQWARESGCAVHDIGPHIDDTAWAGLDIATQVRRHGPLPAADVSAHLLSARFGLLCYPPANLGKSGVFAAYCAHRLCTIVQAKRYDVHDGLEPNIHYAAGWRAASDARFDARAVGARAGAWYAPHDVQSHVEAFKELLGSKVQATT